jgi:antitoxin component of MazEF toxin-antitoxin module
MRTYTSRIVKDWLVTLPPAMVRELNLQENDELVFSVNLVDNEVIVKVVHHDWEEPSWMQDDIERREK